MDNLLHCVVNTI